MISNNNRRIAKFAIIGGSGVLVNMAALWLLHELLGLHYLWASALAILLSIQNNFFWNYHWTFADRKDNKLLPWYFQLAKYHVSASLGTAVNWIMLWGLHSQFGWHYLVANAAGIVAGFLCNYAMSNNWVFMSSNSKMINQN